MTLRNLGTQGPLISIIGMGGHREGYDTKPGLERNARFFRTHQERARIVGAAIDAGVTYFDTTFPCEMESLGKSLSLLDRREGLFISGMRVDYLGNFLTYGEKWNNDIKAYLRSEVEERFKESSLDFLDQFMLGAMEQGDPLSHPALMDETISVLNQLVDEGKIGRFGFSCHDQELAAKLLNKYPQFSTVMVPYNFANRKAEELLIPEIKKSGAAFVAMKSMVWAEYGIPVGALRSLPPLSGFVEHDPSVSVGSLALRWILSNPLVSTVIPAMNSLEEVNENTALGMEKDFSLDNQDNSQLEAFRKTSFSSNYVYLALAGLLSNNLRVRGHGIRVLSNQLGRDFDESLFDEEQGEEKAKKLANDLLELFSRDSDYARLLRIT
jgi:aryl-alcohol dehydrogenase-like predicted oxidoreductase